MKFTLEIDRKWSAPDLAFHLLEVTTIYRIEMLNGLTKSRLNEIVSENPAAFERYLYGGVPLGEQLSFPDLKIIRLSLASPLSETFEGAVRGLTGLAGLIEKLAFFRNTRQIKDIELQSAKLKLMTEKLEALDRIVQIMRSNGTRESDTRAFTLRYLRTIENLDGLIHSGQLVSISKTVSINENYSDDTSDNAQTDVQSDLGALDAQ